MAFSGGRNSTIPHTNYARGRTRSTTEVATTTIDDSGRTNSSHNGLSNNISIPVRRKRKRILFVLGCLSLISVLIAVVVYVTMEVRNKRSASSQGNTTSPGVSDGYYVDEAQTYHKDRPPHEDSYESGRPPPISKDDEDETLDFEPENDYREEEMIQISGNEVLKYGTPQRHARDWIMKYDNAKIDADDERFLPRYILGVLYYALKGNLWNRAEGWLGEEHVCLWRGICCLDETSKKCLAPLNDDENEEKLPFEEPTWIELKLEYNNLHGSLPREILYLSKLSVLDLSFNELTGTIPTDIDQLEDLQTLLLTSNHLEGSLPNELFSMTELRTISLADNTLTGSISSRIERWRYHIETIDFSRNQFHGTIPETIGRLSSSLIYLNLSSNHLMGEVPRELFNLLGLELLDLSDNSFVGSIAYPSPNIFSNLQVLKIHTNGFSGTIPFWISRAFQLESLQLHDNNFHGTIPPELGALLNLKHLYMDGNDLTGVIPESLYQLKSLEWLDLYDNNLIGTISSNIEHLKDTLKGFDVSNNTLNSTIPSKSLSQLVRLEELNLSNNHFEGTIDPTTFQGMTNLTLLNLHGNHLNGHMPFISGLTSLRMLDLEDNLFHGIMFDEFSSSDSNKSTEDDGDNNMKLDWIFLRHNHFDGMVSDDVICHEWEPSILWIDCDLALHCLCCDNCFSLPSSTTTTTETTTTTVSTAVKKANSNGG